MSATPEPVSVALAKAHCRIDTNDEDDLLKNVYIPAARQTVEEYTGRTLRAHRVAECASITPDGFGLALARLPAFDLESIVMRDRDDNEVELDLELYGARIVNSRMRSYVVTTKRLPFSASYVVTYKAGYPEGEVPPNLVLAILHFTGDGYENREAQQVGAVMQRNPRAVALMDPFRITFGI